LKLIVTEKDNVAARIADILSAGKAKSDLKKGAKKAGTVPLYTYKDSDGDVRVVGLRGHILKVDFPEGFENWEKTDLVELVEAPLVKVPTVKYVMTALVKQSKNIDEVIIATDFDREGELIGVDALNVIKGVSPNVKVKRARFSSLTEKEIKDSFAQLEDPYYDIASAGEARQDIDLIWGAALTRGISLASTRLGKNFLSVGRVQSPTLVLIADRELERRAFTAVPYWEIAATFEKDGQAFEAKHKTDRFDDKSAAETIFKGLPDTGEVASVERKERTILPPAPFNTTSFLTAASKVGFTAKWAMDIAERLYMAGFISYPRTDNTVYPPSLDLRELAQMYTGTDFAMAAGAVLAQPELKPTRGKKFATDHPPIYPTAVAPRSALDDRAWKIYELVVRRFFATLLPAATFENIKATIDAAGQPFIARGERSLSLGWIEHYPYARRKEAVLPELVEQETLMMRDKQFLEKETQPPTRYGQGGLIQKMEELGLGTKATRHTIIQNLYDRQYVFGDPIVPTNLGMAVASSLKDFASTISTPNMTAELEHEMDLIADGEMKRAKVVDDSRNMLVTTVGSIGENADQIRERVWDAIRADNVVGACPKCGKDMLIRRAKKSGSMFIGCSGYPDCSNAYPLPPQIFGVSMAANDVCADCGAPKMKTLQKGKPPRVFCPNFFECPSNAESRARYEAKKAAKSEEGPSTKTTKGTKKPAKKRTAKKKTTKPKEEPNG
jgi:DNA topoisomerase I